MSASYPSNLPRPLLSGYGVNPIDETIRTDMESGTARVRRRTKARNDKASVRFLFTDYELAVFRTWFDDAVNGADGGASWFTMALPLGNYGDTATTARIVGAPAFSLVDKNLWQVTASIETR